MRDTSDEIDDDGLGSAGERRGAAALAGCGAPRSRRLRKDAPLRRRLLLVGALASLLPATGCDAVLGLDGPGPTLDGGTAHDADLSPASAADLDARASDAGSPEAGPTGCSAACPCGFPGLVAYYRFEQNLDDESGNGNNASNVSADVDVAYTPKGRFGAALDLSNGAAISLVNAAQASSLLSGLGDPRTFCAWIQPPSSPPPSVPPATGLPLFTAGESPTADNFGITTVPIAGCDAGASQLYVDHWHGTTCFYDDDVAPASAWDFVCLSETALGVTFFVNGKTYAEASPYPGYELYPWAIGSIHLGSNPFAASTTTGASFGGRMDEVTIWEASLTPDELSTLYNDGAGCPSR
jgi:hypothetical protein